MPTKEQIAAALLRLQPSTAGPDFYNQVMGDGINAPSMQENQPGQMTASAAPQPQPVASAGLSPADAPPPTIDPTQVAPVPHPYPIAPSVYVIRKGDTLTQIAQRFGTTVKDLVAKNGIKNKNMIVAGRTLQL